jgi:parvulin-like peptidyl-prolyl isomerase
MVIGSSPASAMAQEKDPVVAKVDQHEIHLSDVYASIESLPLGDQINMRKQFDLVIQSLVNEELLFQTVLSSNLDWERQLRNEIKSLVVERVIKKQVKERIKISDAEIRKYYQENRNSLRGWHVRVRHILMKSKSDCEALKKRIDSEQTFSEMAIKHSLDSTSAANGGDLGYMMYSEDSPQSLGFELQFFEMKIEEMRIFESERGCHLVRVVDIDDPPDPPFEKIKEFLLPRLEQIQERALLQKLIEKSARNVRVEIVRPTSQR